MCNILERKTLRGTFLLFVLGLWLGLGAELWAVDRSSDSASRVGFGLSAHGIFYNGEFRHPLRTGYTLPGVRFRPYVLLRPWPGIRFEGGWWSSFMAGRRDAFAHGPHLSLVADLCRGFSITLGSLGDSSGQDRTHGLPPYAFTHEWAWTHAPEMGARLAFRRGACYGETWIDWTDFIWRNAAGPERFFWGAQARFRFGPEEGFELLAYALARHRGGEIDTSGLSVETSWNLGGQIGWQSPPLGDWSWILGASVGAAYSRDGTESSPLDSPRGLAISPVLRAAVGGGYATLRYLWGSNFVGLRAHDLFSAYSDWGPAVYSGRQVLHACLGWGREYGHGCEFGALAELWYDLGIGRVDWDFVLRLAVDFCWDHPLPRDGNRAP